MSREDSKKCVVNLIFRYDFVKKSDTLSLLLSSQKRYQQQQQQKLPVVIA